MCFFAFHVCTFSLCFCRLLSKIGIMYYLLLLEALYKGSQVFVISRTSSIIFECLFIIFRCLSKSFSSSRKLVSTWAIILRTFHLYLYTEYALHLPLNKDLVHKKVMIFLQTSLSKLSSHNIHPLQKSKWWLILGWYRGQWFSPTGLISKGLGYIGWKPELADY